MDKVRVLAAMLVISLSLNAVLILGHKENPVSDQVSQSLLYAYHQAFPPLENTTVELSSGGQAPRREEVRSGVIPPDQENLSLRDLLLLMEEEGALNESIVLRILAEGQGSETVEEEQVQVEPEPTPDPGAWKKYTSGRWKFSLPYPPTWEIKEGTSSNPAVTFLAPTETKCSAVTTECYQYVASLAISIDQNPDTFELEEYFNKRVSRLQKDLAITATSKSAPTSISGNKAYWIEYYTRDSRGNPSKSYMQYFTILDKKAFILTYSGPYSTAENVYSMNKQDAQKMIDTFVIEREYKVF